MPSLHTIAVTFKAKPNLLSDFRKMMQSVKVDLPKVEGCKSVRILTDIGDASTFLLVEDWHSQDAHATHIARLIEAGVWSTLEAMLREPPSSITLTDL